MDNSRLDRFKEDLQGTIWFDDDGNEISLEEKMKQIRYKKAKKELNESISSPPLPQSKADK